MKTPHSQTGAGLIEVLVSILIFSFGILGLVALHARGTQLSVDAEDRNRAALLANEIATQMLTMQSVNLAETAVKAWQVRVANAQVGGLPQGVGNVVVNGNVANITITWRPPSRTGGDASRLTTQVVMP
jgi:type IV pilus assembly protein PilV